MGRANPDEMMVGFFDVAVEREFDKTAFFQRQNGRRRKVTGHATVKRRKRYL